jgi:ATP phosphoribosyltransferase regulatory subunit
MASFPYYSPADIEALNSQALAILKLFAARGYLREEPSVLQPAEIFLDRSGEEIRRRTYTLTDLSGQELCLRPDLTIPICKHALDAKVNFPARFCYNGVAFRHQPSQSKRPTQFFQAGVELLGLEDSAAGETEILSLTFDALRAAGLEDFQMLFGDMALFGALVDALEVPAHWRARLKRHFWRAGYVETLLDRLGHGDKIVHARREIEAMIDAQGEAPLAGRTREEIIARALEREAEAAAVRLDPAIVGVIGKLFGIAGPVGEAMAQIRGLLKTAGIKLNGPLAAMDARIASIRALGLSPERMRFTAHFGRNMEYYTGLVFELWSEDGNGTRQIAAGGRYDTLMQSLGADRPVSAVGCAIQTECVLAARKFRQGVQ